MRGLEQIPWLYDLGLWLAERGGFGRWRRWLPGGAAGRTLDLGTGTGRNLPWLPPGLAAVAVDPCPQNLAAAHRRAPGVALVRARAEALPFKGGAFDTVLSGMVLCSVDDPAAGLAEVRRVLAPGGAFRLLEHVRAEAALPARLQDLVQPAWTLVAGGCRPNRDTERLVAAAGFELVPATRVARGNWRRLVVRAAAARPAR
ncbi:MAG: class I SAM-dependent methyltransferase [Anaeromyxobacter sp.]|nr:class I SAM-dependent methyltransferase [Anaeromyxobacter sp.]MBL0277701.1 class I SAM-dependent methyltransferase [Anaeromyxobacter sp.]